MSVRSEALRPAALPRRAVDACLWAAVAALFAPLAVALWQVWSRHPYGGHGMLAPLFAGVLVWRDWAAIRAVPRQTDVRGAALIVMAALALALGLQMGSLSLQVLALIGALAGVVWLRHGAAMLGRTLYPIVLLLLMLPLPTAAAAVVSPSLQLTVADMSGRVLGALGVPFFHDGARIELAAVTLEVAEVCNGLRFAMALLTLSLAQARLMHLQPVLAGVVVASALPMALAANVGRVVAIAVAVYYGGTSWASGPGHHAIGKAVWLAAVAMSIGWTVFLARTGPARDRSRRKPCV
jgi:exosortase